MKRFLFPLIASLAVPITVSANSTWIKVYTAYDKCESMGYKYGCDFLNPKDEFKKGTTFDIEVDTKSINIRGEVRDFTFRSSLTDGWGSFNKTFGKSFNCSNETYYTPTAGGYWAPIKREPSQSSIDDGYQYDLYQGADPGTLAMYKFVCDGY